jgi:carbon storage regulator
MLVDDPFVPVGALPQISGYPERRSELRPAFPKGVARTEARMLVLTRKTNQSIMIGDDVEVTVLAVSRDKIRLGIAAPKDVPVYRKEVYLSIKGEESADEDDEDETQEKVTEALNELRSK